MSNYFLMYYFSAQMYTDGGENVCVCVDVLRRVWLCRVVLNHNYCAVTVSKNLIRKCFGYSYIMQLYYNRKVFKIAEFQSCPMMVYKDSEYNVNTISVWPQVLNAYPILLYASNGSVQNDSRPITETLNFGPQKLM